MGKIEFLLWVFGNAVIPLLVFGCTRLGFLGVGWQWVKVLRLRFFEVNPLGHAIRVGICYISWV